MTHPALCGIPNVGQGKTGNLPKPLDWNPRVASFGSLLDLSVPLSSFAVPCQLGCQSNYAEYYVRGVCFPVGQNSLCLDSPYYFSVKPCVLAVCIAPHRYISRAALSPPACIHRTLRPNDLSVTCITDRAFRSFHFCASWRTISHIPAHAPQNDLFLEVTPLKINHPTPPPPHSRSESIAEWAPKEHLQQNQFPRSKNVSRNPKPSTRGLSR
jgi:hypothetical protein